MSRFVVTELAGILTLGTHQSGLSCYVIDTQNAHRVVFSWCSEKMVGGASGGL